METVEEMRAVRLVRVACAAVNLATFEWSIASGLVRCGSDIGELVPEARPGGGHGLNATGYDPTAAGAQALYNSKEPAQALSNLEAMSLEAAFVLKDFHRHMDDPVVVRRLRDVGQKFSANRRTVIITAPSITIPPELGSLVEFLELPLPDKQRLRQIIDEMSVESREVPHSETHPGPNWPRRHGEQFARADRGRSGARHFTGHRDPLRRNA